MSNKFKNIFIYIFGLILGKLFYPKYIFKSKYFKHYNSKGWKWVIKCFLWQKILGINRHVQWPVSQFNSFVSPQNLIFDIDDLHNFMGRGCYFQSLRAKIVIGNGTYIAANVGLITENHDIFNPSNRAIAKDVIIGSNCWIGMNSVILPGVILGDNTTVGAGSIVTKSFFEGKCVIAGNPAKIIKRIS